jgi:hypothetical protein
LAPDIRSRYYSRSTFKSLWRQYFQYGFWKIRVLQLHPKQMSLRQFIPFGFVSAILFFSILSIFFSLGLWAFLALLALYFLTNFLATVKSASRINFNGLPYIFLSFPILHFAYGLGFMIGLFTFWRKWSMVPKNYKVQRND